METAISINKYIYSILSNDEVLAKKVGNNIFPLIAEDSVTYPFIIFKKISVDTEYTKDGRLYDQVNFSILIVSDKYNVGVDIAERVRELLENRNDEHFNDTRLTECNEDFIDDSYVQELLFTTISN